MEIKPHIHGPLQLTQNVKVNRGYSLNTIPKNTHTAHPVDQYEVSKLIQPINYDLV